MPTASEYHRPKARYTTADITTAPVKILHKRLLAGSNGKAAFAKAMQFSRNPQGDFRVRPIPATSPTRGP